jgi:uncharacterized protein (TIGR02271 family)
VERTIFALFEDALAALGVASALEREGYTRDGISLLVPDPRRRYVRQPSNGDAAPPSGPAPRVFRAFEAQGLGPAAITGRIAPVLTDATREQGGLIESLTSLGFVEPAARHYYESLRRGQAVLAVATSENEVRRTVELLRKLGARAVDDIGAPSAPPVAAPAAAPTTEPTPPARDAMVDQVTVPVVEEQLEIGKRQVQRGGVRINSHVIEEPVQERVSLREERVKVERRPVSREATEEDLADFKEGSIEIHETIEEAVVTKRRRVVEEIVVGKETRERTETVSDTVRKTHVVVEPLRSDDYAAPSDPAYRYADSLARDERYRGAKWSDIEPQARREWEREHDGGWDQFRDAVRTAWQKVSGHSNRAPNHD